MNRWLLTCAMAFASDVALAQSTTPLPGGFGPPGMATTPGMPGVETEEQALRRQVLETLQARIGQMSPEQLRRALAVIEGDGGPLPPAAEEALQVYRQQAGAIQEDANRRMAVHRRQAVADLREIQDRLTRDGKLDEAVAVRDLIRSLAGLPGNVQPDPGTLYNLRLRRGQPLCFRVTGNPSGSVWGTDVYTDDSTLSAAAVHAGVLRNGQTGIIKVTLLPGRGSYGGTTRNGVTSSDWGDYSGSFRVEAVPPDEDLEAPDAKEPDVQAKPVPGEPPGVAPGQ